MAKAVITISLPLELDGQCPQRSQLPGRVANHPMFILVDILAGRRHLLSVVFAVDETGFHGSPIIYELSIRFYNPSHV